MEGRESHTYIHVNDCINSMLARLNNTDKISIFNRCKFMLLDTSKLKALAPITFASLYNCLESIHVCI